MMKERSTAKSVVTGAVVLVLICIGFFVFRGAGVVRNVVFSVFAPRSTDAAYAFLSRDALIARLSDAEGALARSRWQGTLLELMASENQELRALTGARELAPAVAARVIARPPRTHYDSLIVDRGEVDGVAEGNLVLSGGIALGHVASVGSGTALVELFSNPGSEHDVLLGEPSVIAIARGLGGGAFELSVPQDVEVSIGDLVRLPGSRSLALGVVADVSSKPTDVSKTVRFAIPASFAAIDFIEIVPAP